MPRDIQPRGSEGWGFRFHVEGGNPSCRHWFGWGPGARPWTLGSREDGYLLGVRSLIKIWSDEFRGDIPLNAEDWHYRAEGHLQGAAAKAA